MGRTRLGMKEDKTAVSFSNLLNCAIDDHLYEVEESRRIR